jgi:hypothetical protein
MMGQKNAGRLGNTNRSWMGEGLSYQFDNKVDRRGFLRFARTIAASAFIGSLPIMCSACKGSPTIPEPSPQPPPPGKDVTVTVKFYNHTQGPLGEKQYQGKSNESLALSISQLGFNGVYPERIAVRKAADANTMGSFLGFAKTGGISIPYPQNDETWEAYLMNFRENAYELYDADEQVYGCKLSGPRNITWQRRDIGLTGPDEPIIEAVRQINVALDYPWKRYGSLTQSDNGDIGIGYTDLTDLLDPYSGSLKDHTIFIDPNRIPKYEDRVGTFIIATFGYLTRTGLRVAIEQLTDKLTGNLAPFGKDLLGYFYVKDATY